MSELTLKHVAERTGVSPATLRRWVREGLIPQYDGAWTPAAVSHARVVSRLRARGHTLEQIRQAGDSGRLATGYIEDIDGSGATYTVAQAAHATGLEEALIERIYTTMGFSTLSLTMLSDEDVGMLRYAASALAAGLPLVALLQLLRVYGQALAQIADAEVRLVHMYVHEPLMRDGVPGLQITEEMQGLVGQLLPFAAPFMTYTHGRYLQHFIEQDVIGHMEADPGELHGIEEGRLRVAIAFADLAGYTRLTEERGDEEAVSVVERFVEAVEQTLPVDARVIKTLGDEVMIVGPDPVALTVWAVSFQARLRPDEPAPRIGIHHGETLYRDGDYYGREVNQAARVVARAAGGEVLVTRTVVDMADGDGRLGFELIGEVGLKGFSEPTELLLAYLPQV
ncbi:MAG TPA: adenylate cyclase regulatory domain-containing protein [Solirubrobacteraceae bacterium]|nr:adenylate cyclase regulatory domain-containing protein [Solirubrobacteraceae bacterium]